MTKSGCSASKASGVCSVDCRSTTSCHHTSRPSVHSTSCPVRGRRGPMRTSGHFCSASSTAGLSADGRAAAVAAVGGDDDAGVAVDDPVRQRVGGEAAEHHGVRRAEPGAGQHRDDRLGDHRQVDRDPVAGPDAELGQRVRRLADLVLELGVGDRRGCRPARPPSGRRPGRRGRPRRAGRRSCRRR